MGSTAAARRAGREQATVATKARVSVDAASRRGSRELSSAQSAMTLFKARLSARPATMPAPTLVTVEAKTMRSKWPRGAPRGHAYAEFVGSLHYGIGDNAVKAHRRQRQCKRGESDSAQVIESN